MAASPSEPAQGADGAGPVRTASAHRGIPSRLNRTKTGMLTGQLGTEVERELDLVDLNLPAEVAVPAAMVYRSSGLGVYAVCVRYCTMPLERIAMIMNSSQVSGSNQLSQAAKIVFADGPAAPYRTVGRASVVAWFFQYSVRAEPRP